MIGLTFWYFSDEPPPSTVSVVKDPFSTLARGFEAAFLGAAFCFLDALGGVLSRASASSESASSATESSSSSGSGRAVFLDDVAFDVVLGLRVVWVNFLGAPFGLGAAAAFFGAAFAFGFYHGHHQYQYAVSYTHLTLPTSDLV